MDKLNKKRVSGIAGYTLCIFIAQWLLASVHSAVGTYQTEVIAQYGLEDSAKGLVSSTLGLFTIATFTAVLFLTGRFKKAHMLAFGLTLGSVSLCLCAMGVVSRVFGLLLCLIGLTGVCCGAIDSLCSAVLSELYPGKGSVMCLFHATYGCAGLAMPFVFSTVGSRALSKMGFRSAYVLTGLLTLLLCVLLFAVLRRGIPEEKPAKEERVNLALLKEAAGEKRLLPVFISAILGGMYLNTMLVWTPRFIVFGHGGESLERWALPCVYLAITLSRLLMSLIKPDMRKTLKLLMPFSALGLVAAILIKQPVAALSCVFISLFCCAPVIPFQVTIASNMLPKRRFIVTLSLMFIMMLGQTVIAPVIGAAESAWGINAAMGIAAGAMALSWLAALRIKA